MSSAGLDQNGQWSKERLNEIGLTLKDQRLPTPSNHGGGVPPVTPTGPKDGGPPHSSEGSIDGKRAAEFQSSVESIAGENKRAKGQAGDSQKKLKHVDAIEAEGAALAREIVALPEFAEDCAGLPKETFRSIRTKFGKVRATASSLVVLALNIADAYEMLLQVRDILQSKSVGEALDKTMQVGVQMAKDMAAFEVLAFVTRSTPVAVGLTILLAEKEESPKSQRQRIFSNAVAKLINDIRPGSATLFTGMQSPAINDMELYQEAYKQAIDKRIDYVSKGTEEIGYKDGLAGSKTKTSFDVSTADEEDLGIDSNWMKLVYFSGTERGKHQRNQAIKRPRRRLQRWQGR